MGLRLIIRQGEGSVFHRVGLIGSLWCLFLSLECAAPAPATPLMGLPGNHRVVGNIKADFYDRSPAGRLLRSYEAFLEAWYFDDLQARIVLITSGENKELGYFWRDEEPRLWVLHRGQGFYFSRAKRTRLNDGMFEAVSPYFHILFMKEFFADTSLPRKEQPDSLDPSRRQVVFSAKFRGTRRDFLVRMKSNLLEQIEESFDLPGAGSTFSRTIAYADYGSQYPAFPRSVSTEFWAPYPKSLYPRPIPWIKIVCDIQEIESISPPDDVLQFARSLATGFEEVPGDDVAASARAVVLQNIRETEPPQLKDAKPIPPGVRIAPLSARESGRPESRAASDRAPRRRSAAIPVSTLLVTAGVLLLGIGGILAAVRKFR